MESFSTSPAGMDSMAIGADTVAATIAMFVKIVSGNNNEEPTDAR